MLEIFIKGLIIGIFVSAPVGPIGILCLQRTLNGGRAHGFATALGATVSDLLYAIVACFSMSFIVEFIESHKFVLQLFGSVIVLLFGIYTYATNPVRSLTKMNEDKKNYVQDFFTSFGLTITNPLIILLFIGLFSKFAIITETTTLAQTIASIFFILMGAIIWWTLLVNIVNKFRSRFNLRGLYVINKMTGIILAGIATFSLISTLFF